MIAPFPAQLDAPDELLEAVVRDAVADADSVIEFFRGVGFEGNSDNPTSFPAGFLLDLAAALRFFKWENRGLQPHLAVGMPPAKDAIRLTLLRYAENSAAEPMYRNAELKLLSRFAWGGPKYLNAEIELHEVSDDVLVDAFVDFLLASRHGKQMTKWEGT